MTARPGHRRARRRARPTRIWPARRTRLIAFALTLAITAGVAYSLAMTLFADASGHHHHPVAWGPRHPIVIRVPAKPTSYIGAYAHGVPGQYAPLESFAASNGVRPNLALYYSGWGERFRSAFAEKAAAHHATTLVQIDPEQISLKRIASGYYDKYLRTTRPPSATSVPGPDAASSSASGTSRTATGTRGVTSTPRPPRGSPPGGTLSTSSAVRAPVTSPGSGR